MNNIIDFAFPYILQVIFFFCCPPAWLFISIVPHLTSFSQFIREYTSKVDELVKDKIDAQKEVKAKEQEEKELVAKQVLLSFCIIDGLLSYSCCLQEM